jgi:hypothetical protein
MTTSILKLVYMHIEIINVLAKYLGVRCKYTLISIYLCAIIGTIIVYVSGIFSLGTLEHVLLKLMLK